MRKPYGRRYRCQGWRRLSKSHRLVIRLVRIDRSSVRGAPVPLRRTQSRRLQTCDAMSRQHLRRPGLDISEKSRPPTPSPIDRVIGLHAESRAQRAVERVLRRIHHDARSDRARRSDRRPAAATRAGNRRHPRRGRASFDTCTRILPFRKWHAQGASNRNSALTCDESRARRPARRARRSHRAA